MNAWNKSSGIPVSALFLLGTCPVLAGCDSFFGGLLLGAVTVAVFALTSVILYLLRGVVNGAARVVSLLATASALAGIAAYLMQAYCPVQYAAVGLYVPLTALQCVALDRMVSDKNPSALTIPAAWYVAVLCAAGLLREFLGAGTLFGARVLPDYMEVPAFFHSAPGAFMALAFLLMVAKAGGLSLGKTGEEA
ncbi:MAG: hypothetical protein IJR72_06075 [Oscillospiraceae bacterium]|nr:hypothetical protein [Oscillospiraceae bacterium]